MDAMERFLEMPSEEQDEVTNEVIGEITKIYDKLKAYGVALRPLSEVQDVDLFTEEEMLLSNESDFQIIYYYFWGECLIETHKSGVVLNSAKLERLSAIAKILDR